MCPLLHVHHSLSCNATFSIIFKINIKIDNSSHWIFGLNSSFVLELFIKTKALYYMAFTKKRYRLINCFRKIL